MKRIISSVAFGFLFLLVSVGPGHAQDLNLRGSIEGLVWIDANKNGVQDPGEVPFDGGASVTVNLLSEDGSMPLATTVTINGLYSFDIYDNIGTNEAVLQFVAPDGYVFSPKVNNLYYQSNADSDPYPETGVTDPIDIRASDQEFSIQVDAGIYQGEGQETTSIGDFVWEDINRNGLQDPDEPGLRCVKVNLYVCDSQGGPLASTRTNKCGYYLFEGLAPGSYYVEFVAPKGYVFTTQYGGDLVLADPVEAELVDSNANFETGLTDCFELAAGESNLSIDAGLYQPLNCKKVRSTLKKMWPPNHKKRFFRLYYFDHRLRRDVTIKITCIRQDEPVHDRGDGYFAPDAKVYSCHSRGWVRAERCGGRNGRVYHIRFRAKNPYGESCRGEITVVVPKSMSKKWRCPVDDGPRYDSTAACSGGNYKDKNQYQNKNKGCRR
jgi:hypothetical protein